MYQNNSFEPNCTLPVLQVKLSTEQIVVISRALPIIRVSCYPVTSIRLLFLHLDKTSSIYIYFMSVVYLFVSNKRQNGWTDPAQIYCGTSHEPREGLWIVIIKKNSFKNFWFFKMHKKSIKKQQLKVKNRIWLRSAPEA